MNTKNVALAMLISMVAFGGIFVPAGVAHADVEPECSLNAGLGAVLYDWSDQYDPDRRLLANQGPDARKMPLFDTPVPAGNYKITVESFDNHTDHPGQNQKEEQWYLQLRGAGHQFIANVGTTRDVPEEPTNYITDVLSENFAVPEGVLYIRANHELEGGDSPESVRPVCALFEPVAEPSQCDLVATGDDILVDFRTFPDSAVANAPEKVVSNQTLNHAKRGPKNFAVPTGVYKVTLQAFDGSAQPQDYEQYRLDFLGTGGSILASSGETDDLLDDGSGNRYVTTEVNSNLFVPVGVTKLRAIHSHYGKPTGNTGPNSVEPVCALLEKNDIPQKPARLTLIKDVINDDGGTATSTDFKLFVDTEKTVTPQAFPIQLTSHETVTLQPGEYTIYEETLPGYNPEGWTGRGCTGIDDITGVVKLAAGQHITCTITNNDIPENAPRCDFFTATPSVIDKGKSSMLEWGTTNAVAAEIDQSIGSVPVDGSTSTSPLATTLYTLTATGDDGTTATCSASVTVKGSPERTNVSIDKSVDKREGQPGDVFTYTLTYSNTTKVDAHDVTLIDTMWPADIVSSPTIVQQPTDNDSDDDDGVCTIVQTQNQQSGFVAAQNMLVCDLGDKAVPTEGGTLESGVMGTIVYQVTVTEPGTVYNDVIIKTSDKEIDPPGTTDNVDNEEVVVANTDIIDLTVEKLVRNKKDDTSGGSASGTKNDSFIYTLTYRNLGQKEAVDVVLRDDIATAGIVEIVDITQQPPHSKKMVTEPCKIVNDGLGIECQLGDLEGLAVGTLEYKADAIDVGTTPNDVFIDPEDTVIEEDENNNDDHARVTVTSNAPQADVTITKSVTPGSGEQDTVFTYTLTYENIGNIEAENVTIDDNLVEQGFLGSFTLTKDPDHGTCDPINEDNGNLHCDLGALKPGGDSKGTIKYTAVGIKDGSNIENVAVIRTDTPETIDEDDDPTNNIDNAFVTIDSDGGGSGGSGGSSGGSGGSSGRRRPNVVLFSEPEVAGVSLVAVPYTGVGDIVQIVLYFLALAGVAGGATYAVLKYRKNHGDERFSRHMEKAAKTITARPVVAPRSPLASIPNTVEESATVPAAMQMDEKQPAVSAGPITKQEPAVYKSFDAKAQAMKVLISADGKEVIAQSADNDENKMTTTLERVVGEAEKTFPREDGWLLLNRTRVEEILFSKSLSTVPLFVQWLVNGNQRQIFSFVRSLSQQGRSPEEFVQQVVAALDAVYRSRVDGVDAYIDSAVNELVEKLSREELEAMITNLTRGIDGGYRSVLDGVKVAVTRIMNERISSTLNTAGMPNVPDNAEAQPEHTTQEVDQQESK